jgi:hypothetical protein
MGPSQKERRLRRNSKMLIVRLPNAVVSFFRNADGGYSLFSVRGRSDNLGEIETPRVAKFACADLAAHLAKRQRM